MNREHFNAKLKVWSGARKDSIYNTNVGLGFLILEVLKKTPELVTQVSADTNVELTCHVMRQRTLKIASHLISCGFKQGDVVGVMATNSENLAPTVFACLTLGLPVNFLAPVMIESDVVQMFSKTKPKLIFCDANIVNVVQSAVKQTSLDSSIFTFVEKVEGCKFVDDLVDVALDEKDFVYPDLVNIADSTAFIMCSSGTTGLPKGVCKSHRQIITQVFSLWDSASSKQELIFNFSTLYWVSGLYFLIIGSLYGQKRVITCELFSPDVFVEIVNRFKVSMYMSAPSGIAQLLRKKDLKPLESLQLVGAGGSLVSKALCDAVQPFIPNGVIRAGYGATEVDILAESFSFFRTGSVGKTSANVQLKIINENGESLGPNEEGEICSKTPVMFSGYFDDPEKTAEASKDGWVYSGDIGYFDDDRFLFIVDRKKDMLKFNNFQVYPSELEEIINQIEGVTDSCVVGVFEDLQGNDLIFAFVTKDSSANELTEKKIEERVSKKVIDAKKLRGGVHFVDALPMTHSGKVQRNEVKNLARKIYEKIQPNIQSTFRGN